MDTEIGAVIELGSESGVFDVGVYLLKQIIINYLFTWLALIRN